MIGQNKLLAARSLLRILVECLKRHSLLELKCRKFFSIWRRLRRFHSMSCSFIRVSFEQQNEIAILEQLYEFFFFAQTYND